MSDQHIFNDISHEVIQEITDQYLSDLEGKIVFLMRMQRRNKEIAQILNIQDSEVVRLRKNLIRKIECIYRYHYMLPYMDFLRFCKLILTPRQYEYLDRYFVCFYKLHEIASEFKTQASNCHRALKTIRYKVQSAIDEKGPFSVYLGVFEDLSYLNINRKAKSPKAVSR